MMERDGVRFVSPVLGRAGKDPSDAMEAILVFFYGQRGKRGNPVILWP
jgi:hypothetical protein